MSSSCGRFGVLGHRADRVPQSFFELIQGHESQVRPFGEQGLNDGFNDDGGTGTAGARLHLGFQGGSGGSRVGEVRDACLAKTRSVSRLLAAVVLHRGNRTSVVAVGGVLEPCRQGIDGVITEGRRALPATLDHHVDGGDGCTVRRAGGLLRRRGVGHRGGWSS